MYKADVCLTPDLIDRHNLGNRIAVVVDILRATSCMVTGLAHHVVSIKPFTDLDECLKMREKGWIVAGERGGKKVEGFDMGNSPFEYMADITKDKHVAVTTTNGTVAIEKSQPADMVIIGAFLNLEAIGQLIRAQKKDCIIVCAGWKGKVNLEDTLFAGALLQYLEKTHQPEGDSAWIARQAYINMAPSLSHYVKQSEHALRLASHHVVKDIDFCLKKDEYQVVPVLRNGELVRL
ncbi:MAG: 2-phosphosulfolactate phosphatase [Cyclobacteriaceae bacterium]|nr:2-phosphosulfolactate phosphatase [Cyclobacteriaceae bacterium]